MATLTLKYPYQAKPSTVEVLESLDKVGISPKLSVFVTLSSLDPLRLSFPRIHYVFINLISCDSSRLCGTDRHTCPSEKNFG